MRGSIWSRIYVDSSDDEENAVQSANSIPHLDDHIYVNINEPLVSSVKDDGVADEEKFIHEDNGLS